MLKYSLECICIRENNDTRTMTRETDMRKMEMCNNELILLLILVYMFIWTVIVESQRLLWFWCSFALPHSHCKKTKWYCNRSSKWAAVHASVNVLNNQIVDKISEMDRMQNFYTIPNLGCIAQTIHQILRGQYSLYQSKDDFLQRTSIHAER